MFSYVSCILFTLHSLLPYSNVFGERIHPQKFIIEDGVKSPIFGSYSYEPLKQEFQPPLRGSTNDGGDNPSTNAPVDVASHPGDAVNITAGLRKRVSMWSAKPVSAQAVWPVKLKSDVTTSYVTTTKYEVTTSSTHWWARAKLPINNTTAKENLNTIQ